MLIPFYTKNLKHALKRTMIVEQIPLHILAKNSLISMKMVDEIGIYFNYINFRHIWNSYNFYIYKPLLYLLLYIFESMDQCITRHCNICIHT